MELAFHVRESAGVVGFFMTRVAATFRVVAEMEIGRRKQLTSIPFINRP
jgi:phytoene/squalene synthetase